MPLTDPLTEVHWVADTASAAQVRRSVAERWLRSPFTWLTPAFMPPSIATLVLLRNGPALAGDAYAFALLLCVLCIPAIWLEPLLKSESPRGICAAPGTPMTAYYHHYSLRIHTPTKDWNIGFSDVHTVTPRGHTVLLTGKRDLVLPSGLVGPELVEFIRSRAHR
ncbi:hypothetical protein [Nocardia huaxiensis]|uniref:hypothetical protein n=1 Tax=Nocardia huaxiensis TaxID=2755382 RepID=UPI001E6053B6|nr:hypothetical protein [Nocardia huaxiensis]UFS97049.1 hypothetical protein LPY97_03695 [Nocardia huaxiensis]